MKKLLIICLSTISLSASAQKISSDVSEPDGTRIITTYGVRCNSGGALSLSYTSFQLSATVLGDGVKYTIGIDVLKHSPYYIKRGNLLLLKTFAGETIELRAVTDADARFADIGYRATTSYSRLAQYSVSREELERIVADGVQKYRMQTEGEPFEDDFSKDKVGKALGKALFNIDKALNTKKDFRDGF